MFDDLESDLNALAHALKASCCEEMGEADAVRFARANFAESVDDFLELKEQMVQQLVVLKALTKGL